MYDGFGRATRRAVLDLYRSVPDVGAAGTELARRAARRSTGRRSCCGAHATHTCASSTPSASARRSRTPRYQVLEHAAHWPFVDEPEHVRRAVIEFLDRQFERPKQDILAA